MSEYWLEPPCEDDTHAYYFEMSFEEYQEWLIDNAPTEEDMEQLELIYG